MQRSLKGMKKETKNQLTSEEKKEYSSPIILNLGKIAKETKSPLFEGGTTDQENSSFTASN